MSHERNLKELAEIIGEHLRLPPEEIAAIGGETTIESLGINSLELVDILMTIEERHDIHIEIDAVEAKESIRTVDDMLELGRKHGLGDS